MASFWLISMLTLAGGVSVIASLMRMAAGWTTLSGTQRYDGAEQCPACGYGIGSTAIERCPECGGSASKADRQRWRSTDARLVEVAHNRLAAALMLFVLGVFLVALAAIASEMT